MLDFLNSLSRKLISQPERVSTDTYSNINIRPYFELETFRKLPTAAVASIGGIAGDIASATYDPVQFRDPISGRILYRDVPLPPKEEIEPYLAPLKKEALIEKLNKAAIDSDLFSDKTEELYFGDSGTEAEAAARGLLSDFVSPFFPASAIKAARVGASTGKSIIEATDDYVTKSASPSIMEALTVGGALRGAPSSLSQSLIAGELPPPRVDEQLPRYPEDYSYDLSAGVDFELPKPKKQTARAYTPPRERAKIEESGLAPKFKKIAQEEYKKQSKRYPTQDGWQPLEIANITDEGQINWQKKKFDFARDRNGKLLTGDAREKRIEKLSEKIVKEIEDTHNLAKSGDYNSQIVMNGANWYEGIHGKLTEAFGGSRDIFGDLSAALSPNVKLSDNMKIARTATAHYLRGDYDKQLEALAKHIEKGGSRADFPDELIIRKPNGTKYNMNSYNAMLAMIDEFRKMPAGSAPKMRQYGGNLVGNLNSGIIDIWASRNLQRHSGFSRLPVKAEIANAEGIVMSDGTVSGSYGFAQEVYRKAGEKLGLKEDMVQALQWMKEKEKWERNRWTSSSQGNKFVDLFDKNFQDVQGRDPDRYLAGLSLSTEARPIPTSGMENVVQRNVRTVLDGDKEVIFGRSSPNAFGRYAGADENAFDIEVTATKDFNPEELLSTLAQTGKENDQWDVYLTRILSIDEVNPNARPALEVYFKRPFSKDEIQPYVDEVVKMEEDGFTFIPKTTMRKGEEPTYTGFRMQFIPELEIRWDEGKRKLYSNEEELNLALKQKRRKMLKLASNFVKNDDVVDAKQFSVDTVVAGKGKKGVDDYDEFINDIGDAGGSIPRGGRNTGFGRPIFTNVRGAIKRIEGK